jgi:formylglycine-generating enzyme required for sulfatase activity
MRTFLCGFALGALLLCSACASDTPAEEPGMVYVQKGKFTMGYDKGRPNEKPEREVTISKGFHIDKTEVTNEEYARSLNSTKRQPPAQWPDAKVPEGEGKKPVTGISYEDAKAFAEWAGKTLPSEEQWEYAARGPESKLYPWGAEFGPGRANNFAAGKNGPVEVGSLNEGASWVGALDMAGNVWEWTRSEGFKPGEYIIKGGSYAALEDPPRASLRASLPKGTTKEWLGFRCIKE